ncbi:MAG: cobalt-precorrin-5B (C(1))-methyltransferase, partial [Thermoguttaceae bacterium]|nr:cobalt-precorrin-5B (C(1))-methyltransferase [Thermoguttaceae bacterium]
MRFGFTTGSCAAAAAKAAAYMLLTGEVKERVSIVTPKGIAFDAEILDIVRTRDSVTCGVRKDAGDDPDVTSGCVVRATVTALERGPARVEIDGGEGVGRVTKPGLDQPVGAAAINSAPRAAIEKEALEVADALDFEGTLRVVISVPGGKELAEKTFNPRLGIVGGVSILGTSGIVEPMSVQALI